MFIIENITIMIITDKSIMNLQDFEAQYREAIAETLNELQAAVLLLAEVQNKISKIGNSVQNLSQRVEEFIAEQKAE